MKKYDARNDSSTVFLKCDARNDRFSRLVPCLDYPIHGGDVCITWRQDTSFLQWNIISWLLLEKKSEKYVASCSNYIRKREDYLNGCECD